MSHSCLNWPPLELHDYDDPGYLINYGDDDDSLGLFVYISLLHLLANILTGRFLKNSPNSLVLAS